MIQRHISNINCYTVINYLLIWLSFCIIIYFLANHDKAVYGLSSVILLMGFGFEYYVKFQFTKNAGLYTIAGIILITEVLKGTIKRKSPAMIMAGFLIIAGSFARFEAAGMAAFIMFPYIIWVEGQFSFTPEKVRKEQVPGAGVQYDGQGQPGGACSSA